MKQLKHRLSTCAFSVTSTCCWRPVDAELDDGVGAMPWSAAQEGGCHRAGGYAAPSSGCAATDELLRGFRPDWDKRRCRTRPTIIEPSIVCRILCRALRRLRILSTGASREVSPFASAPQTTSTANLIGSGAGIDGRRSSRGEDNVVFVKREQGRG